jgi:hypothetical protein
MSVDDNKAIAIEFLTAIGEGRGREVSRLLTADATWWISEPRNFPVPIESTRFSKLRAECSPTLKGQWM